MPSRVDLPHGSMKCCSLALTARIVRVIDRPCLAVVIRLLRKLAHGVGLNVEERQPDFDRLSVLNVWFAFVAQHLRPDRRLKSVADSRPRPSSIEITCPPAGHRN